jgi:lipoprotein-anchoring transpeptidase ErfK/SrfK
VDQAAPFFSRPEPDQAALHQLGAPGATAAVAALREGLPAGPLEADAAKVLGKFPVAIGAPESPTPTGFYSILEKIKDPTYYSHSKKMVFPPGPSDPVGTRWMEFLDANSKTFGIHGTAWPQWVHRQAAVSLGCVRMLNPDVEQVFSMVQLGTPVRITPD